VAVEAVAAAAAGRFRRPRTLFDAIAISLAAVSLVAEWTVGVPPARMPETFGYETVVCWAAIAGLAAALVLESRLAGVALVAVEAVLVAWFGWAIWVVTTPRFTSLGFPFLPTDVIGSGYYLAWAAVLAAAGAVTWEL